MKIINDLLEKVKKEPIYVFKTLVIIVGWYISNKFFELAFYYGRGDILDGLVGAALNTDYIFTSYLPSFKLTVLCYSVVPIGLITFYVYNKRKNKKKFRKNIEYGSSKFGTSQEIKKFMNNNFNKNIILSKTEGISMFKATSPAFERNKNACIIGGSGSGKTRFVIKPNLMQLHSSYVVTDPKGTILNETGKLLSENDVTYMANGKIKSKKINGKFKEIREPYKIKVLNTINFKKSNKYNPFVYMETEADILKFVDSLIANTTSEYAKGGDDFWVKAEKLLYTALISYIKNYCDEKEQNMSTLIDLLDAIDVDEDKPNAMSETDLIFDIVENGDVEIDLKPNPTAFCVRQYKKYKKAAGKTAKSILISCGTRLAPFDIQELRELMSEDELELDMLGNEKTALFVINSDTDTTFNFVIAIMYSQLFNILCTKADDEYNGKLPIHVRCLFDEFANIGKIPNFDKLIATIRSRNISAFLILQAKSQLKTMYKEAADTIIGNCDSEVFLGGKEGTTLKDLSESMGKETIDIINNSASFSNNRSVSRQEQKLGRELMTISELKVLPGDECIVQIRGINPFKSKKYDITKHPNYKYLYDGNNKQNYFDYENYLKKFYSNELQKATKKDEEKKKELENQGVSIYSE